jgi:hypothetical protein
MVEVESVAVLWPQAVANLVSSRIGWEEIFSKIRYWFDPGSVSNCLLSTWRRPGAMLHHTFVT